MPLNVQIEAHAGATNHEREAALRAWLCAYFNVSEISLMPIAGDASFRRYFRLNSDQNSYVVMDAPPEKEACEPFLAIARTFLKRGVKVPTVYSADAKNGFVLLSDFGDALFSKQLNADAADALYGQAFESLITIQKCKKIKGYDLPTFTVALYNEELERFQHWYLEEQLGIALTQEELMTLKTTFDLLIEQALAQPQILVHRDYHSRNLMVLPNQEVGVLDFQDALKGPVTYDLVSLLRDCYISWPEEKVTEWAKRYFDRALAEKRLSKKVSFKEFMRWFDWMGVQRHLKCLYIFSRQDLLYDNPDYLQYIPRTLNYVLEVGQKYPEFEGLMNILKRSF